MTIGEQLQFIAGGLQPWAQEIKASVAIVESVAHLVSQLVQAPGSPRILIMVDAEEKRGEYEELGRVDRRFLVVVSRGVSMRIEDGRSILEGAAGGRPFYDLLEECREVIRGLRFDHESTERIPNYVGMSRVQVDGFITDARQLAFTIGTQLPLHTEEEEDQE